MINEVRIVSHLNYANVMSTIAVFFALGGAAFAVSNIDGSELQNRSVAGKKLKDETVKGQQINESSLGQVPSAQQAQAADNANLLDNLDSLDFERSTTILDGQALTNATNPQGLFNALAVGASLTTDGDSDTNTQLRLTNNNASGNIIGTPFTSAGPGAPFGVAAGTNEEIGPASGGGTDFLDMLITDANGPASRSMWIHCLYNFVGGNPAVWCWGVST